MTRFSFASPRPSRRPSLTPMVDVIFLLLVFFMLAARFGQEGDVSFTTTQASGGIWEGPPRLVLVEESAVALNGRSVSQEALIANLAPLMPTPEHRILVRPDEAISTQRLLDVMSQMLAAGYTNLLVLDP